VIKSLVLLSGVQYSMVRISIVCTSQQKLVLWTKCA